MRRRLLVTAALVLGAVSVGLWTSWVRAQVPITSLRYGGSQVATSTDNATAMTRDLAENSYVTVPSGTYQMGAFTAPSSVRTLELLPGANIHLLTTSTLPSTVTLVSQGSATIQLAVGVNLTVHGPVFAPPETLFSCDGLTACTAGRVTMDWPGQPISPQWLSYQNGDGGPYVLSVTATAPMQSTGGMNPIISLAVGGGLAVDGGQLVAPPGGATTVGAFNGTSTANAADITGTTLTLHAADGVNPGAISTTTQTMAGLKTFAGGVIAPTVTGTAAGLTLAGGAFGRVVVTSAVRVTAGNAIYLDGASELAALVNDGTSTRLDPPLSGNVRATGTNGLVVDGKITSGAGVILNTGAQAKPTCAVGIRGTLWYTPSGAGVADAMEICGKSAADAYAWKSMATF